jgi:long-chain acyl-CoA synthetase
MRTRSTSLGIYPGNDVIIQEEVLEADGWFHTGDIAEVQKDGAIKIIDRKKNIFKLSQGEYVAVEKLEAEYKKTPVVEQVWVHGETPCLTSTIMHTYLVLYIVNNE